MTQAVLDPVQMELDERAEKVSALSGLRAAGGLTALADHCDAVIARHLANRGIRHPERAWADEPVTAT